MKTTRALTLLCMLAALGARAAQPKAEIEGSASPAEVTIRDARRIHYRLWAGETLSLSVSGPARLRFEVRIERVRGARPAVALVELDGKVAAQPRVLIAATPKATSNLGLAVSRATVVTVNVPAGKHAVAFRWPAGTATNALVAVRGVAIAGPRPEAQASAVLPLPAPAASKAPATPLLPLPGLELPRAPPAAAEPVAPPPAAVAVPAAAPAPAAAPPREVPAVAVAEPPRAQAPLAAQRPTLPDANLRRPDPDPWTLTLFAGGERSSETFTAPATLGHVGVEAKRSFWASGLAVMQLDWRTSQQTYVNGHPGAASDITSVDEYRYDALLAVGYDFGHLFESGRLSIAPMVGLKYVKLQNSAFPLDLFGVDLMGRVRYALSPAVAVHGSVGWMYNLAHPAIFSALGSPLGQFGFRAGLEFPLAGGYALSLDYQGDILAFDYSYRVAHGATAGFGKSF